MFKLREKTKRIILYFFLLFLFILDRYLKKSFLFSGEAFYNRNLAFNLYLKEGIFYLLFFLVSFFLILGLILSLKKKKNLFVFSFGLIITGAVSNFIDRILYSAIIDYWRIPLAVFNLADLLISAGILLLLVLLLWKKEKF
ncbi:signal peptidase II [Candidatus Kuenenbacteria bacterium]|nr:signal peptidase II [Candidatus Kuenenbacteria bacterium]PIZ90491.1 MAG: hypothetical protein COX87_00215 [bacterium (Candidatus Moisslbacteria) CG_4_10_14_0_2_um_filter_36_61]